MTCQHKHDDPTCSSYKARVENARALLEGRGSAVVAARDLVSKDNLRRGLPPESPATPDKANYTIEEYERIGFHLVMKVRYPNCAKCAYEGHKVMVFLNVAEADVIRWREIDPHFRDPKAARAKTQAPSPAARFPASPEGWKDAVAYAGSKVRER